MLKARVITALALVAGLLGVLFYLPPWVATLAFGLVASLAAWEWAGLMKAEAPVRVLFALMVAMLCWQFHAVADSLFPLLWIASAAFWLVLAPLWLRYRWSMASNDFLGYAVGFLLTVPTWAALVALNRRGAWVLVGVMAVVWIADSAAYFSGRAFGKHKLAPAVSPGKTWEGVAGALLGTVIYGVIVVSSVGTFSLAAGLVAIVAVTAISVVGDLFESLMKRQAGVKDSSTLLPGHGGVLDRIDSLTAALPLAALVFHWSGR